MKDDRVAGARSVRLSLRVFVLFAVIYLCTSSGHYTTGDGTYKVAWAKAMLGQLEKTSAGQNAVYSKYGIGHSLLALPPLAIAQLIHKTTGIRCEAALYTLMFVLNGALFLALVAFYLSHFYRPRSVWFTVSIAGLATIWWPYTKLDFSEPLVLTVAFLGFLLMRFGYPAQGMIIAGFTLAIRADSVAVIAPIIAWYLWTNRVSPARQQVDFFSVQAAIRVALCLAPSIGLVLFANYIRYHSLLDHGYASERFSNPLLVGVYGILLSAGKSIFLFSPPLLLGVIGWKRFADRAETRADAWLFLGICVAQVLLFAKWWDWSSDDAWGVRFLIPGVLLMCIPMVTLVDRPLFLACALGLGLLIQIPAVAVGGLDYLLLLRSQPFQRQALYVGGYHRVDFEDIRFDPNYNQIMGNWILLRYLLGIPPVPGRPEDAVQLGTRLWDAVPSQTWAAAARWDFIWNSRRSAKPSKPLPSAPVP